MTTLHYFSLATAPIQVSNAQATVFPAATAFFYETEDTDLYLITNWHVMTGRDPANPTFSKTGAVPSVLKVKLHNKQEKVNGKGNIVTSDVSELCIPINSPDGDEPQWLEHPEHKFKVDTVAIKIQSCEEFRRKYEFNIANKWKEYQHDYEPEAMDDVFVIGYPWGLSTTMGRGGVIPVYKKGCIASDPVVDFRRLPHLLIDCRTTKAMSGSPVIASRTGIFMPDGRMSANTVIGTVSKFLGVYSGRLKDDHYTLQDDREISEIGIVWKASVLEAITRCGVAGSSLRDLS